MGCPNLHISENYDFNFEGISDFSTCKKVRIVNFLESKKVVVDYSPFGVELYERGFTRDDYRYSFNGMEKDDEVKGGSGNHIDFGARCYDSRLGRLLSLDRFHDKNPSWSPYSFVDNDPIYFIDYNGDYRMPKRLQRKYPQLTNVLKNLSSVTQNDLPRVYAAFKETLNLTDAEAQEMLSWGSGPKVRVGKSNGYADTSPNGKIVTFDKETAVAWLEGTKPTPLGKEGTVFLVYATALHEPQHVAENTIKGKKDIYGYEANNPAKEAGLAFEIQAFLYVALVEPEKAKKLYAALFKVSKKVDYVSGLVEEQLQPKQLMMTGEDQLLSNGETTSTSVKVSSGERVKLSSKLDVDTDKQISE